MVQRLYHRRCTVSFSLKRFKNSSLTFSETFNPISLLAHVKDKLGFSALSKVHNPR